jgi:Tfp pilus assembly protein PilN
MFDSLKTYWEYGNRFCGIEHALKGEQAILFASVLKKSKNTLDIETSFEVGSVAELNDNLIKKSLVFLIINNEHVLTKRIESGLQSNPENNVLSAFPSINLDDFYYVVNSQNNTCFVSICRKSYINNLIERYASQGIFIIGISFGNHILSGIAGFLTDGDIYTSNSKVSLANGHIGSIEQLLVTETIDYDVNGLSVNNFHLLSLSGALELVIKNASYVINFNAFKDSLKNRYKQSRFFYMFLRFGLVLILAVLLINFFVFNHYFNKVNRLQQTSQINLTNKEKVLQLKERVNKSQKMVDDMLKKSASKSSFYVNAIIQSLPESILLSELNYQPLLKNIKNDKPVELSPNTIIISGISNHSESFSKWINTLENIKWVDDVNILSYEDTSKKTSKFSLKLKLTI